MFWVRLVFRPLKLLFLLLNFTFDSDFDRRDKFSAVYLIDRVQD